MINNAINCNNKKSLACFMLSEAAFETCFPILYRLNCRGNLNIQSYIAKRLLRIDKRYQHVFKTHGLTPQAVNRIRLEMGGLNIIRKCDGVLDTSDIYARHFKLRLRLHYIRWSKIKTIFIQHGMHQQRVNWADDKSKNIRYYADKILLWEKINPWEHHFLKQDITLRSDVIGFPKQNLFPRHSFNFPLTFLNLLKSYKFCLLICTNFNEIFRFSHEDKERFFIWLAQFCQKNQDILVIFRPHRGRTTAGEHRQLHQFLSHYSNIILSERHRGLFKYANINDCLGICDACISHSSTCILDSVYYHKPTAVIQNHWPSLAGLPQINSSTNIEQFINNLAQAKQAGKKIMTHFGNIENNIDWASEIIEDFIYAQ